LRIINHKKIIEMHLMNPEQKAKDLIHKHLNYFGTSRDEVDEEKAKQSAIITVDEILNDFASFRLKPYMTLQSAKEAASYWAVVRTELDLL